MLPIRKHFISLNFLDPTWTFVDVYIFFNTMWLRTVVIIVLFYKFTIAQYTAVLILARGGSKGIRLKNLCQVGGISLLARSIITARTAGYEDITVSTDHPLIALEALKYDAKVFKRSYVTSTDWAPSIWGVSEFLEIRTSIDVLILLQTTSPLLKAKYIQLSVKKLNTPVAFDCIFSITRSFKLRWNYNRNGVYPVNFNHNNRPRRQDWAGELIETGAFYIFRKELIKKGYLQNNNCTVWEVPHAESLEVDTPFDLYLANILLSSGLHTQ